jgi:hypothetical protein
MNISNEVIAEIRDRIYDQLVVYQKDLDFAYNLSGDDPLDVKLGAKVAPDNGKKKITTSIGFIKDRCKDTTTSWVDDMQENLFDEKGGTE